MPNYQCNVCDEQFTGDDALDYIQEHILTCAITMLETEKESDLLQRLKQQFPIIAEIEQCERVDYDEPYTLRIIRQDGSTYIVPHQQGGFFRNEKKVDAFTMASRAIEAVEKFISDVLELVKKQIPTSDIHFIGMTENTGYLGNIYRFALTSHGEVKIVEHYRNDGSIDKFVERILSYYATEITGVLTKWNDIYTIDGVSINQWLLNHVGQSILLKEKAQENSSKG